MDGLWLVWRALTSCCQFAAFLQSTYMAAVMGVLSKDRELALPFINLLEEQLNFHKVCEWRGEFIATSHAFCCNACWLSSCCTVCCGVARALSSDAARLLGKDRQPPAELWWAAVEVV